MSSLSERPVIRTWPLTDTDCRLRSAANGQAERRGQRRDGRQQRHQPRQRSRRRGPTPASGPRRTWCATGRRSARPARSPRYAAWVVRPAGWPAPSPAGWRRPRSPQRTISSSSFSTDARKPAPVIRLAKWSAARIRQRCAPSTAAAACLDGLRAQLRVQLQSHPRQPQRGRTRLLLERRVTAPRHRLLGQMRRRGRLHVLHHLHRLQRDAVHVQRVAQQRQRQGTGAERGPQRADSGLHPHHGRQERAVAEHPDRCAASGRCTRTYAARARTPQRGQGRVHPLRQRHGGHPPAGAQLEHGRQPVADRALVPAHHGEAAPARRRPTPAGTSIILSIAAATTSATSGQLDAAPAVATGTGRDGSCATRCAVSSMRERGDVQAVAANPAAARTPVHRSPAAAPRARVAVPIAAKPPLVRIRPRSQGALAGRSPYRSSGRRSSTGIVGGRSDNRHR